jgi:CRISPR-associated Csx2 family protein
MTHALVTFLGRGQTGARTSGYKQATYRFPEPDAALCTTSFFGLALAEHLKADRLVILGTPGSMWGVLVEHAAGEGEQEEARLALMDAEAAGSVNQRLLDGLGGVLRRAAGREVVARIIPPGRTEAEQHDILQMISAAAGRGDVSFDLTHGFRHLGMLGMLSAFMLERIGRLAVRSLWYGALDMSEAGVTPVLRLDGLSAIQRWVAALDRFDASGDYGVFAPLLEADGVPADKARCLEEAAFHERTFHLGAAWQKLQTFRGGATGPLAGASGLFQQQLEKRLAWIDEKDLGARQRRLAEQYLCRSDFVRAAVFAWEALVSRSCKGHTRQDWETRQAAADALDEKLRSGNCDRAWEDAFRTLRTLRNALAHGIPPQGRDFRRLLASPERLRDALRAAIDALLE